MDMSVCNLDKVLDCIEQSKCLGCKLVLLVGSSGSGKTELINKVASVLDVPRINLGIDASLALIPLSVVDRTFAVSEILQKIIRSTRKEPVLLDNIEVIFDKSLQINPLELFKKMAQERVLVVAWPGYCKSNNLVYAGIGYPDYREFNAEGLLIITIEK